MAAVAAVAGAEALGARFGQASTESSLWDLQALADAPCPGRPLVYYAWDLRAPSRVLVAVKGPMTEPAAKAAVYVDTWKRRMGLPSVHQKIVWAVPDRFGSAGQVLPKPFLVSTCLIPATALPYVSPGSYVMDWSRVALHIRFADDVARFRVVDYVHALLVRYLFGISDASDRNFLVASGGIVVGVDEDSAKDRRVDLRDMLGPAKSAWVSAWIRENFQKLEVNRWALPRDVGSLQSYADRLRDLQTRDSCVALFS